MIALAPMKSSRYYFFKWKQYHKSQSFRITMRDAAAFRKRRVQKGVLDHWHLLTATGGHWAATRERMYKRSQRGESLFASTSMTVSESSYRRNSMVRHTFSRSEVTLKDGALAVAEEMYEDIHDDLAARRKRRGDGAKRDVDEWHDELEAGHLRAKKLGVAPPSKGLPPTLAEGAREAAREAFVLNSGKMSMKDFGGR